MMTMTTTTTTTTTTRTPRTPRARAGRRRRTRATPARAIGRRAVAIATPLAVGAFEARARTTTTTTTTTPTPTRAKRRVGRETTLEELRSTLARDVGVEAYFVTGRLTEAAFAEDCRFVDPTTDVKGLRRYLDALGALFDPQRSSIRGTYALEGYLRLPWRPKVPRYEGRITWTVAPNDGGANAGLIVEQRQTWSVSGFDALRETFTPSF
ncbi:hypothetical protein BE221DRAFT_164010, partial [Ostreococcus tauri]